MNNMQEKLGVTIMRLRQNKGLSQEEFARRANITNSYISYIEHGKKAISIPMLERIASNLDLAISELFFEAEKLG